MAGHAGGQLGVQLDVVAGHAQRREATHGVLPALVMVSVKVGLTPAAKDAASAVMPTVSVGGAQSATPGGGAAALVAGVVTGFSTGVARSSTPPLRLSSHSTSTTSSTSGMPSTTTRRRQ